MEDSRCDLEAVREFASITTLGFSVLIGRFDGHGSSSFSAGEIDGVLMRGIVGFQVFVSDDDVALTGLNAEQLAELCAYCQPLVSCGLHMPGADLLAAPKRPCLCV